MVSRRKSYTREFKVETVKLLIRQSRKDRTLSDLARALGTSWP